jgi:hypothetical protein
MEKIPAIALLGLWLFVIFAFIYTEREPCGNGR